MKHDYDVIIIGAGVGGLVCGCYLAQAGLKVLIIEQHDRVGGCCTSFVRKGISFDSAVHSLGSCREDGILGCMLRELELVDSIKLHKWKYIDSILLERGKKLIISRNSNKNLEAFCSLYPNQSKQLRAFFEFINSYDRNVNFFQYYKKTLELTFKDLLRHYFTDRELIAVINLLLFNVSVPSEKLSALSAIMLFKEFIFDGGYYPKGGMQAFSNTIADKVISYNGKILLSQKVKKIRMEKNRVKGVEISDGTFISSKIIVSACDAVQTYFQLIGKRYLGRQFIKSIGLMRSTSSVFTVYLALNRLVKSHNSDPASNIWYFPLSRSDKNFSDVYNGKSSYLKEGIFSIISPKCERARLNNFNKEILYLFVNASYKNIGFWRKNKEEIAEDVIGRAEKIFPGLRASIFAKEISTPIDIERYTFNFRGSTNGWAYTPEQIKSKLISVSGRIDGLFMTGHWLNQPSPGGIPSVVFLGKKTAQSVASCFGHNID